MWHHKLLKMSVYRFSTARRGNIKIYRYASLLLAMNTGNWDGELSERVIYKIPELITGFLNRRDRRKSSKIWLI